MTDRDAKHPTGPLPRDADGDLILKRAPDLHGFIVGQRGVCRVREGYAGETNTKQGRLYQWRCVEGPAPRGSVGATWILYLTDVMHSSNTAWFDARFERIDDYEALAELIRAMPEPTPRQREEQALSFAYGNLALSTNHKPSRAAFEALASDKYGWTADEIKAWADARTWERP